MALKIDKTKNCKEDVFTVFWLSKATHQFLGAWLLKKMKTKTYDMVSYKVQKS